MDSKRILLAVATMFSATIATGQETQVTLQVESGTVMTSRGGPFAPAASGARLNAGDRVMLSDQRSVRLLYGDGCSRELTAPGVYAVAPTCAAGTVAASGGSVGLRTGALITGVAVAGVIAVVADAHDDDAQPISR